MNYKFLVNMFYNSWHTITKDEIKAKYVAIKALTPAEYKEITGEDYEVEEVKPPEKTE